MTSTSLIDATRLESIDQVRFLIYSGQNVNEKDWVYIVFVLPTENLCELIVVIVLKCGDTPLLVAARDGMMGILKFLLIMGADVNAFNQVLTRMSAAYMNMYLNMWFYRVVTHVCTNLFYTDILKLHYTYLINPE